MKNHKPTTQFIKRIYKKKDLVGVEVGVWKGSNAYDMISFLPIKKLYLIDPYKHYDNYDDYKEDDMDNMYDRVKEKFKPFGDKVKLIRKMSIDAVEDIPDGCDFIYIDANHSYEFVKKDLKLFYPKVKKGGIFCGHDYNYIRHPGVTKAVNEFSEEIDNKVYSMVESIDSRGLEVSDWWMIKK